MTYQVRFRSLGAAVKLGVNLAVETALVGDATDYMTDFMQVTIDEVRTYPPPTGGGYVRTNRLFNGWRVTPVRVTGAGLETTIINVATDTKTGRRYMPKVQGPWQTPQHAATGWIRIDQAKKFSQAQYRRGLQDIFNKHARLGF